MDDPADGYDGYYQVRLWESLPVIYRVLDTATFADLDTAVSTGPGPLRELVNRIGRRSPWSAAALMACGPTSR